MNLLIAILSNTFDNVQSSLDVFHLKSKIEILLELSEILVWERDKTQLEYIHFVHYANQKLSAGGGGDDEWVGRVRAMTNKI